MHTVRELHNFAKSFSIAELVPVHWEQLPNCSLTGTGSIVSAANDTRDCHSDGSQTVSSAQF